MCPRTCCCPRCPPYHPSDGNKDPPRQPLSPHRPLVRSRRLESPRRTPGTPSPSSRAAAVVLPAFARSGQLLTGLACGRRSTFGLPRFILTPQLCRRHACPRRGARRTVWGRTPGGSASACRQETAPLLFCFGSLLLALVGPWKWPSFLGNLGAREGKPWNS